MAVPQVQGLDRSLALLEAWIGEEDQAARKRGRPLDPYLMEMRRHSKPLRMALANWHQRRQQDTV